MAVTDPVALLERSRTVAVVGCSTNPGKDAHRIPSWLQDLGFDIHPVHPTAEEILGRPAVATLADLEVTPDLVVVFRPPAEADDVTRQAIEAGAAGVWLQLGITSAEARARASAAGIDYVEDACSGVVARRSGIRHP